MRHLHQCTGHNANLALRPSRRLSPVLRQDHSKCRSTTSAAIALRHLPGSSESPHIEFRHMANSRVGQQLLDGRQKLVLHLGLYATVTQFIFNGRRSQRPSSISCARRSSQSSQSSGAVGEFVFDEFRHVIALEWLQYDKLFENVFRIEWR